MTEQDNDKKAQAILEACMPQIVMLKEAMERVNIPEVDLLRALYLIENIQKISGWGNVKITIKNKEIISITGENSFISEGELKRNLKAYTNR